MTTTVTEERKAAERIEAFLASRFQRSSETFDIRLVYGDGWTALHVFEGDDEIGWDRVASSVTNVTDLEVITMAMNVMALV